MSKVFICQKNSDHQFPEHTADMLCPLCPVDDVGMLSLSELPETSDSLSGSSIPAIDTENTLISSASASDQVDENASLQSQHTLEETTATESEQIPDKNSAPIDNSAESPDTNDSEPQEATSNESSENNQVMEEIVVELPTYPTETFHIDQQEWTVQNLAVTARRDGTPLFHAQTDKDWKKAFEEKLPAYCWPNNDSLLAEKTGMLYNFYALTQLKNDLPEGMSIPSVEDIQLLTKAITDKPAIFLENDLAFREEHALSHRFAMGTFTGRESKRMYWTKDSFVHFMAFAFEVAPLKNVELKKMDKNAGCFIRCIKRNA